MYQINNFTDNDDIRILDRKGPFTVIEYKRDLSVTPQTAAAAYYCNEMIVRKRQVVCELSKGNVTTQAGAMHWMVGNCNATTGLKGVGDFFARRCVPPSPTRPPSSPSTPATAPWCWNPPTAICC